MAGRKVDTAGPDDIPDLALPAQPVARSAAAPAAPARRSSQAALPAVPQPQAQAVVPIGSGGGRELPDDDDPFGLGGGGPGLSIELDVAPAPPPSLRMPSYGARASGTMAAVSQPKVGKSTTGSATSIRPGTAATHGPSAGGAALGHDEIDPYDARALADYGEPPAGVLAAPLYSFRVLTRQRELRRTLTTRRLEAERAQAKLEAALVGFGERARAILESTPGHHRMLEDVVAAEHLARARDGKLAGELDAHRARAAVVDARIAELDATLVAAREEERLALEVVARAEAARARVDARARRREIEARNEAAAGAVRDPRAR